MAARNMRECVIVDDQFAVVPAELADAYFKLEAKFPRRPSLKVRVYTYADPNERLTQDMINCAKTVFRVP